MNKIYAGIFVAIAAIGMFAVYTSQSSEGDQADPLIIQGRNAYLDGRYDQALNSFGAYLDTKPEFKEQLERRLRNEGSFVDLYAVLDVLSEQDNTDIVEMLLYTTLIYIHGGGSVNADLPRAYRYASLLLHDLGMSREDLAEADIYVDDIELELGVRGGYAAPEATEAEGEEAEDEEGDEPIRAAPVDEERKFVDQPAAG